LGTRISGMLGSVGSAASMADSTSLGTRISGIRATLRPEKAASPLPQPVTRSLGDQNLRNSMRSIRREHRLQGLGDQNLRNLGCRSRRLASKHVDQACLQPSSAPHPIRPAPAPEVGHLHKMLKYRDLCLLGTRISGNGLCSSRGVFRRHPWGPESQDHLSRLTPWRSVADAPPQIRDSERLLGTRISGICALGTRTSGIRPDHTGGLGTRTSGNPALGTKTSEINLVGDQNLRNFPLRRAPRVHHNGRNVDKCRLGGGHCS
jgi:hypothetical protein